MIIRAPFNKSNLIKLKYFPPPSIVLIRKTTHEQDRGAHARCTATHYTDHSGWEEGITKYLSAILMLDQIAMNEQYHFHDIDSFVCVGCCCKQFTI